MLLGFIFCLFILSLCLFVFKWNKAGFSIMITALLLFLLIGSGVFVSFINLQETPFNPERFKYFYTHWKPKNTIILLGSGTVKIAETGEVIPSTPGYARIYQSAHLYFSCKKSSSVCNIIISGGDVTKSGRSEAATYKDILVNLGVKSADIIVEDKSLNTFKNAEFCSKILIQTQKEQKNHEIFLVTSAFHLPRSLLYFAHFNIFPIPVASDYFSIRISFTPTSYNFLISDFVVKELIGYMRYSIYNALGLNPPSSREI